MLANQLEKMSSPTMARSCFFTRAQRSSSPEVETVGAMSGSVRSARGARATAWRKSEVFNMWLFPQDRSDQSVQADKPRRAWSFRFGEGRRDLSCGRRLRPVGRGDEAEMSLRRSLAGQPDDGPMVQVVTLRLGRQ